MAGIPSKCPKCGRTKTWKEKVNILKGGIPVGSTLRIRLLNVRGLFAEPIKEKLGYYKVKYRCHGCGFEETYELPH